MTDSMSRPSSCFFLPTLKEGAGAQGGVDVRPGAVGLWDFQSTTAFQHVASSLEVPSTGRDAKSVSSIPDMWARPLSMEMALHNKQYPIRGQMIEQWQGMLAAIALSEVRGFNLKAELIELEPLSATEAFARSLYNLQPTTDNFLYTLEGKTPWQDLYVFLWNGKAVGMSSPSTLICPSEEGDWSGLPWWQGGRLRSPVTPVDLLHQEEKSQIKQWLENLRQELNQHNGNPKAIGEVSAALREFQESLGNTSTQSLKRSTNSRFFGVNLTQGPLRALNMPIQAIAKESSVRIIPSATKSEMRVLLIPELSQILREWGQPAQSIWIYETTNLATLKLEDFPQSGEFPRWGVRCLREQDVFLPELHFVSQPEAFTGGLLPNGIECLTDIYDGQGITPLLPINSMLLDCLTPEDLASMLQVSRVDSVSGAQVQFILDLKLSGINRVETVYRIIRTYPLRKENAIADIPLLELWPNFRSSTWKEYYGFYYGLTKDVFQINFSNVQKNYTFKDTDSALSQSSYSSLDAEYSCQLVKLSDFPTFLDCRDNNQRALGLILLKTLPEVGTTSGTAWTVGVDFGTSFTNVYVERNGTVEPLAIESLHYQVFRSNAERRIPLLAERFIANKMDLPLSTVLSTRGGKKDETSTILDGRIFIPRDLKSFQPNVDHWIRTNLKWSQESHDYNRLFLQHLILQITAQAAKSNATEIQWAVSYPSAFSRNDYAKYGRNWKELVQSIETTTGVPQRSPVSSNDEEKMGSIQRSQRSGSSRFYRTESLAVAQYFADFELAGRKRKADLVNSTCIDIGGGTSDISIWEDYKLIHQCSIQLAGKDLFSQFIQANPGFLKRNFRSEAEEWKNLQGFQFYVKLDILLRRESDGWLSNRRDIVAEEPEFLGLTQLLTVGIAGLYYYVGLLLKALYEEGKYKTSEITPVFLGGNGSRFLNWLAEGGEFSRNCEVNDVLSAILAHASGFKDTEEPTILSPLPKNEVACGLVLRESRLKGLDKNEKDALIAGEPFEMNGESFDWNARMEFSNNIESWSMPELTQLRKFMNSFHSILDTLQIEGILPFEGYQISEDLNANESLWRETARELKKSLYNLRENSDNVRPEPTFILGLKALLQVLGNRWSDQWK